VSDLTPAAEPEELEVEATLRPRTLTEFVGQARVREQLSLVLEGARRRGDPPDHVLLSGPPGLGKTSLALIIAAELGAVQRSTSGPRTGGRPRRDVNLSPGDVLFIDEIIICRPPDALPAMGLPGRRGKGPGATSIPASPFTLVGATSRGAHRALLGSGSCAEFYSAEEPGCAAPRGLDVDLRPDGAVESRGPGAPAHRQPAVAPCARRPSPADGSVNRGVARALESTTSELPRLVARLSASCCSRGQSGVSTLAVAVGEEAGTVEEVCEPYLVRAGMLARTPRGRVATAAAWSHLGVPLPPGGGPAALF
jgi:Holliday junction DNA helicase RuvB